MSEDPRDFLRDVGREMLRRYGVPLSSPNAWVPEWRRRFDEAASAGATAEAFVESIGQAFRLQELP